MKTTTKGFTLIELLISMALFSIVITLVITSFISFIQYQTVSQKQRQGLEILNKAISNMTREIKYGTNYQCIREDSDSKCTNFKLTNQLNQVIEFKHEMINENGVLRKKVGEGLWVPLTTSNSINITKLEFDLTTEKLGVKILQPGVHIKLDAEISIGETSMQNFNLVTFVSQRKLETTNQIAERFKIDKGIGSSPEGFEEGDIISYVYDDSGNCIDDLGITNRAVGGQNTPCDSKVPPKALASTDRNLYILGVNGRIFYIAKDKLNDLLKSGTTETHLNDGDTKTEKLYPKRVVGAKPGGVCRRCSNDPNNITKLVVHPSAEIDIFAISQSGELFEITAGKAKRLLTGERDSRILHLATNPGIIVYQYVKNKEKILRVYTTSSNTTFNLTTNSGSNINVWMNDSDGIIPTKTILQNINSISLFNKLIYITLLNGKTYFGTVGTTLNSGICDIATNPIRRVARKLYLLNSSMVAPYLKKVAGIHTVGNSNTLIALTENNNVYVRSEPDTICSNVTQLSGKTVTNIYSIRLMNSLGGSTDIAYGITNTGFLEVFTKNSSTRLFNSKTNPTYRNVRNLKFITGTNNLASGGRTFLIGTSEKTSNVLFDIYIIGKNDDTNKGCLIDSVNKCADEDRIEFRSVERMDGNRLKLFKLTGLKLIDLDPTMKS